MLSVSQEGDWAAEKVISIPSKKVEGWMLPEMPGECSHFPLIAVFHLSDHLTCLSAQVSSQTS